MGLLSVLLLLIGLIYTAHCQTIGQGTIRLVRNGVSASSYSSGMVQIYYSTSSSNRNRWGNICDDGLFAGNEANVICNQLGYNGASGYGRAGSTSSYGTDFNDTILDDVSCSNRNYLTLQQCSLSTTISPICSLDSYDAYVVCYTIRIWNNPYAGQIRLQGGTYTSYGRLEVYCNGQWGTVCDDSFDATDATVVCRQLGYSDSLTHHSGSTFAGSISQPIWLDRVLCSTSDNCLSSCESCPSSEYDNCGHNEDIAIACEFDISQTASTNTLSTCQYANTNPTAGNVAGIVGGVIAVFVICCGLIIGIPICICCCLGVGIGATARGGRSGHAAVVTTGATSTVTSSNATAPPPAYNQPPPPPPPPAYPAQQGYPVQPGYPQQGYPSLPPPYPPQY